ncbi:DUF7937 domain-containing protein [Nocardioides sp. GXZ039]|uniref:DUF7937 domain-containing protein n=1 Tax=Nocardioides sp. GXZ039 TaxID=3136018 RepID=UPI0030F43D32
MPTYCAHCGATHDTAAGGAYCSNCGQPVHPQAPPQGAPYAGPPPSGYPQGPPTGTPAGPPPSGWAGPPPQGPPPTQAFQPGQPGQPSQQQPWHPGQPYQPVQHPQPTAKINPFQGWPLADYLRDAAAAVALFACLGMPWDFGDEAFDPFNHAGERWWVVIAALLAVVSLAVPYLEKARAIPNWGPQHYLLTKLALNAPLVLSVLAAVIFELVAINDDADGGLGSGMAMALAGVALAIQPRAAEEMPGYPQDRRWTTLARATAASAVVLTVLLFALWVLHGALSDDADVLDGSGLSAGIDIFDPFTDFVAILIAFLVIPLAMFGYPAYQLVFGARSAAWRRALATVGFSVVVVALFALASDHDGLFFWPEVEKWNGYFGGYLPGAGGLLVGAAAGFAVSRPMERATAAHDALQDCRETLSAVLQLSIAGSALAVAAVLFHAFEADFGAATIVSMVLLLLAAGAGGYGFTLLSDLRRHRVVLLGILGGTALLGLIAMIVLNGDDNTFVNNGYTVAAWISLPALGAYALTAPPQVRSALGPLVAGGGASGFPQGPPQAYPQQGYPQPQPPQAPPGQPGQWGPPQAPPHGQPGQWGPPPPGQWGPPPAQ